MAMPFFGIGMKTDLFQSFATASDFQISQSGKTSSVRNKIA